MYLPNGKSIKSGNIENNTPVSSFSKSVLSLFAYFIGFDAGLFLYRFIILTMLITLQIDISQNHEMRISCIKYISLHFVQQTLYTKLFDLEIVDLTEACIFNHKFLHGRRQFPCVILRTMFAASRMLESWFRIALGP
jgi:hypothetical protein